MSRQSTRREASWWTKYRRPSGTSGCGTAVRALLARSPACVWLAQGPPRSNGSSLISAADELPLNNAIQKDRSQSGGSARMQARPAQEIAGEQALQQYIKSLWRRLVNARATWFRRATWWTVLPVSVICATLVSPPAARAQDFNQQSTSAEKDDAVNWRAASGPRHAYARAPYEFQRTRRARSHRHH